VLNARDPLVAEMAPLCDGEVLFFSVDADLAVLRAHLALGHRAVFIRDSNIVLARGQDETLLTRVADIPLTHGGRVGFQIENVLAAVGTAWALDIPESIIRAGIEAFDVDQADAPWQFTLFK